MPHEELMLPLAEISKPFIPATTDLRPFAAELVLIGTAVAVLLAPFFKRKSNFVCGAIALLGLIIALIVELFAPLGIIGPQMHGMLVADPFSQFWKILLILFTIGVVLMWFGITKSALHDGDGPEFFMLLLCATVGMALMASTSNLLMLFLAVQIASLPSYVLAGFRKTHRVGAEASLKYVLFGAATSAVMLYGLSLLYGLYGSLQIDVIAVRMSHVAIGPGQGALLAVSILGVIAGVGFKIAAVPFHFWCPDVFEGASIEVSAFLSVASKGAAIALLLRVLMTIAAALNYQNAPGVSLAAIAVLVGTIGAVTATVGNTAAFVQTNIKRLLAYSSIAHAGYMLCALSLLIKSVHATGTFDLTIETAHAILIYLAVYLFMNLGAFTAAAVVWKQTGSEKIHDYAGLGRRSPALAISFTICLLSLIGLPPLAGFSAKVYLLWVLIQNGGAWWILAVVIGINTILSLYFYLRIVKVMYFESTDAPALPINPIGLALTSFCAAMLIALFVGFAALNSVTQRFGNLYVASPTTPAVASAAR